MRRASVSPYRQFVYLASFVCVAAGLAFLGLLSRQRHELADMLRTRPRTSVAGMTVVDERGASVPLAPAGRAVVLVVSRSCPHCHRLLSALATGASPGDYSRLRVVFIEDALSGRKVLDSLALHVPALGIAGERSSFLGALRVVSTPTLIAVDSTGTETERMVGELDSSELRHWIKLSG
jgi:hypothetical protein